ncbi:MAG: JmjC domain-containing protein [Terriglobia bacterium]
MTSQTESTTVTLQAAPDTTPGREDQREGLPLLDLDTELMQHAIGHREFAFHHRIADHPLLTIEALAELAGTLPPAAVERHAAQQPLLVPGGAENLHGLASDAVRNIERDKHWMVLWNIEQTGEYRHLLDEILDEAMPHLPARERGMGRREAFLFLSAPHSVTPVHFDPEHNFLLQIRGLKKVHVGRFPTLVWERTELDRYHTGGHRNLEAIPPQSSVFLMRPGDGTYIYPWAPHWVRNGPAVSVSLSITFRTGRSECFELASAFNARLRRHGFPARPAGESELVDRTKAAVAAFSGWLHRRGRAQRGTRDYS